MRIYNNDNIIELYKNNNYTNNNDIVNIYNKINSIKIVFLAWLKHMLTYMLLRRLSVLRNRGLETPWTTGPTNSDYDHHDQFMNI